MTEDTPALPRVAGAAPKIGFVSLGCPKALTDSELILTRLSAEGYETSKTFRGRRPGDRQHLRLHRRCGARKPGHDRRGAGRERQGDRYRLPGRQSPARRGGNLVRQMHPSVLAVTGPHATHEVMDAVHLKPLPEAARSLRRSGAAALRHRRRQAHAAPLRLFEDQRRLQPPLHLLHHPEHARRSGVAADRRRAERSRGAVRGRRQGAAGDQPGHQRLRCRPSSTAPASGTAGR